MANQSKEKKGNGNGWQERRNWATVTHDVMPSVL